MAISLDRTLHHPLARIVLGIITCMTVFVVVQNFITKPLLLSLIDDQAIAKAITNYISVMVLLLTYYHLFHFYERRKITELSSKKIVHELFGGFLFGFGVISLVIFLLYELGYYSVLSNSNYSFFLAPFSMLVVAALIEEIVFRGILYRIIENWWGTFISLFIMSFLFELPHAFNENTTFLSFTLGVVFGFSHGMMFTYTGRIWLPFAFHLGWNFAQPFYGSNLSGLEDLGTVITAQFEGPKLLTGTTYGVEDSLFSLLFLTLISILFLYLSVKHKKIKPLGSRVISSTISI